MHLGEHDDGEPRIVLADQPRGELAAPRRARR
jgi:hypothetical protein